ncbi:MAG TPA: ATP-binding protein [Thermoanaerobaculia bacterium]|nr:ATP-binding protein [Thermoanaerobaculia bacterium]
MSHGFFFEGALARWRRRRINRRAFQDLGRSLALIVDREALESSVAARIRELFDPDRLVILQPDAEGASFVPTFATGLGSEGLSNLRIASRGKLARWLSVNETSLALDQRPGVYEFLDAAEKELLARLRLDLCVPMIHLNRLIGILLLGGDRKGWSPSRAEIEMLDLLASQAGLAFENAALYRAQLERLDRLHRAERLAAVGQLAAGLAHEIRNPLTAIRSTMQYLLKGLSPEEPRHQLIEELLSEVDRINSTVGGLLSLSRSGELRLAEVDLLAPLSASVHLVQARADEQKVVLESSFGHEPLRVLADAGQLKQVFLNLLMNALQSMPNGGRITLTAGPWGSPSGTGRWGQVRIADTGPGIPAEELRKAFDPFFTTKRDGTGLGLAICHGIIEQHQGEIRLESETGRGTTALVRLPLIG